MYLVRRILARIFFALIVMSCPVNAALKYEQEVTISSFCSEKETKELADKFCQAAQGDLDLKVIDIRYEQKELGETLTSYDAIIKCHVSKPDEDVLRIQMKVVENDDNLTSSPQ